MTNPVITNVDLGSVVLLGGDLEFRDEALTFPGADTYLEGTILARKVVADAITAGAFVGTGDGTITLATVQPGPIVPVVGAHSLVCVAAVGNGGVFNLLDPNGAVIATDITMTPGAGGTTVINVAGMEFTITDGAADFVVGDAAPLTVVADGKMVVFAVAGAGGAQTPKSVLTYEVVATGAGDTQIRAMKAGRVRKQRLVIDGTAAGVGITDAIIDQLQDVSIIAQDVQELAGLDNQ